MNKALFKSDPKAAQSSTCEGSLQGHARAGANADEAGLELTGTGKFRRKKAKPGEPEKSRRRAKCRTQEPCTFDDEFPQRGQVLCVFVSQGRQASRPNVHRHRHRQRRRKRQIGAQKKGS